LVEAARCAQCNGTTLGIGIAIGTGFNADLETTALMSSLRGIASIAILIVIAIPIPIPMAVGICPALRGDAFQAR